MDNNLNEHFEYDKLLMYSNSNGSNTQTATPAHLNGEKLRGHSPAFPQASPLTEDEALEELRELLISPEQSQIEVLQADISNLRALTEDDSLLDRMTPVVNLVIERQIRESPKAVIDLLYPLVGGMVKRAVEEAIRNLADRIDAQRQKTFSFQRFFSKFRAESNGASSSSVTLRDSLPFTVHELFVIHRESGLLIHHQSRNPEETHDSDIISAMLTAIGDFVQDAFGARADGTLKEIEYGDKLILLEAFHHVYVATVADGIAPYDYRHEIRRRLSTFERSNWDLLSDYDGDSSKLEIYSDSMKKLLY